MVWEAVKGKSGEEPGGGEHQKAVGKVWQWVRIP